MAIASASPTAQPSHSSPRRARRFRRKTERVDAANPMIVTDLPCPIPVTDAEIDLVLGTLGATIARILRDDA